MAVSKMQIREKIIANLASYGIQWNETEGTISVSDFRKTQAKLAKTLWSWQIGVVIKKVNM